MGKLLKNGLQIALVAGCFVYVFWGIDLSKFLVSFKQFGIFTILGALVFSIVPYLILGVRFNFLTDYKAGFLNALKASVFCLGINNIFPAKLGEVAKVFYLRRKTGISIGKGLGMVFWERFADLNMLLILGIISALLMKVTTALVPLAIVVGGIWCFIILLKLFPKAADFVSKLIPSERLKLLFNEVMQQLHGRMSKGFFFWLTGYSILFWLGNLAVSVVVLAWVGQLHLSFPQMLTVFVVVTLGFAAPSGPGAIGVVEAAFKFTLATLFKVPVEQALAIALVFRFISFVPPTLAALYVLAESGLSMKGIREQKEEEL